MDVAGVRGEGVDERVQQLVVGGRPELVKGVRRVDLRH